MKIVISNIKLALEAQIAVSKEETRYYLNGFSVEPVKEGVCLVSTNGHMMVVLHDPNGSIEGYEGRPPIIKLPPFMVQQIKRAERQANISALVIENGSASLLEDGKTTLTAFDVLIDGRFPDWRKVLPKLEQGDSLVPAPFNAKYIGSFSFLSGNESPIIKTFGTGENSAHIVKISGRDDAFGVIMPCRSIPTNDQAYPTWIEAISEAAE